MSSWSTLDGMHKYKLPSWITISTIHFKIQFVIREWGKNHHDKDKHQEKNTLNPRDFVIFLANQRIHPHYVWNQIWGIIVFLCFLLDIHHDHLCCSLASLSLWWKHTSILTNVCEKHYLQWASQMEYGHPLNYMGIATCWIANMQDEHFIEERISTCSNWQ